MTLKDTRGVLYLILYPRKEKIKTIQQPRELYKYKIGSPDFVRCISEHHSDDWNPHYKFYTSSKTIHGKKIVYYACKKQYEQTKENKHELLHPVDTILFFGNVYVFLCDEEKRMLHLTEAEYTLFYERAIGYTIELGSSDSEYSSDSQSIGSLEDFIVSDSETVSVYSEDDEL